MPYRILITPIVTESGFRDSKTYEVQKEGIAFNKGGLFRKASTTIEWATIATYDTIGPANKLLAEKIKLEVDNPKPQVAL